jgi:hypothetical protein
MLSCWKAINITYTKRVFVDFGIQYIRCLRHIVICGLSGCTIFFHVISLTARFLKKKLLDIKFVVRISLQNFSGTFLILRRTERDMVKNVCWSSPKECPLLLPHFNEFWIFFDRSSENIQISNLTKIRPVGAKLFLCGRADGRTDGQTCRNP